METTMYGDGNYGGGLSRENVAQMKRKFTLDLNCRSSKKAKASSQPNFNSLLTSPDLHMLKLGSPELDQLVLQHSSGPGFYFPQPSIASKVPTPSVPTQEEFVKGFQDTLDQFHHKEVDTAVVVSRASVPTSCQSLHYTQLEPPTSQVGHGPHHEVPASSGDDSGNFQIKEEPHTVPGSICGSPPVSPINMEAQERIKLERKRLRNRIAASKCRKRKLDRISKLEEKVEIIKEENGDLLTIVNRLRDQVCLLKQEVIEHVNLGCQIPFVNQC